MMTLATGVVVVAALYLAREVLLPITLAILLSFVLAPLVDVLRRIRFGRVPAVLSAALLSLCVILSVSAVIGSQIAGLVNDIPRYNDTLQDKIHSVQKA
ncbi:MAG: AI-2E family transporter, partial [Variovorax sp.]